MFWYFCFSAVRLVIHYFKHQLLPVGLCTYYFQLVDIMHSNKQRKLGAYDDCHVLVISVCMRQCIIQRYLAGIKRCSVYDTLHKTADFRDGGSRIILPSLYDKRR